MADSSNELGGAATGNHHDQGEVAMTRRRSILGVLLICGLSFLAFGASSASATSTYICEEVAAGTGGFTDSHCTKKGTGNFATVKATKITKVRSTSTTKITVTFNVGKFMVHIECGLEEGTGSVTNEVVKEDNQAIGKELTAQFSKCTVKEPVEGGCKLKGEGFEVPNAKSTTYMINEETTGVRFSPTSGETLAKITLEGCKASELNGTYSANGGMVGVVNKESPSQLEFTEASSEEGGLTIGESKVRIIYTRHSVVVGTEKTVSVENP
jgi:hypothetical protein